MSWQRSRRDFLKGAVMTGAGLWVTNPALAVQNQAANDRINVACIGVGGKGESDTSGAARFGNIVALCDIDETTLRKAAQKYPSAKQYTDFRKMLDEMGGSIDAVTVSTPDHMHAPAALMAMKMGKHCFCQKPLTHSLWEAREMARVAREKKLATQMGNQGTATDGLRRSAAILKSGALGVVKEVHVWTNRPIWPQGGERLTAGTPPDTVHWDLWLGVAPERPYAAGYHPFKWRGYWDFGTGALGDMACHTMNMPFMGLDLRNPISVEAHTSGSNKDSYPKSSQIRYEFAGTDNRPALTMYWYDGGKMPPAEVLEGITKPSDSGSMVVGEKGRMYTSGDYGDNGRLIGVEAGEVQFTHSPGHVEEWFRAMRGGEPAVSNFPDYAVPLTETVLLGNLAVWADGQKVEWDANGLRAKNNSDVARIVKPEFRSGWGL